MNDPIHPWRWRALTIWIVAFTLLTAYSLWAIQRESGKNDRRFCDVTSAFLRSESELRDQLNKGDLIEIGLRQSVQRASRNGTYVFTLLPQDAINPQVRNAVITFFQALDDLEQAQVRLGQAALARTDAFVHRLDLLRRRLRC